MPISAYVYKKKNNIHNSVMDFVCKSGDRMLGVPKGLSVPKKVILPKATGFGLRYQLDFNTIVFFAIRGNGFGVGT